jgi:hypothetical protein
MVEKVKLTKVAAENSKYINRQSSATDRALLISALLDCHENEMGV